MAPADEGKSKRMKSDKYCLFHKDRGHSTEECLHLKDEIEKLIRRGYLKEYVDRNNRPREGNSRPPQERRERETRGNQPNQDNPPTAGVIGVISGGPAGGDSARARKAALRAARNHSRNSKARRVDQGEYTANKLQREHSGTHRRSDASHLLGFIPKASNQDARESTSRISTKAHQCIRMGCSGYGWNQPKDNGPSIERKPKRATSKTKEEDLWERKKPGDQRRSGKTLENKLHPPVQYPEWLANVVLVPKANGKWRMCVDFTDLNKACPKDSYPCHASMH
ncbi:UNVERIFIED_CONTAM: hypothetical protein Sradi_5736200 [Sesamum radiatum]|uniref:Reverse transcriptase domain-containing protein n=1 Tax=Sesamum radiatum TaxID=300843 RepID=A0AAW2L3B6_SESRA